MGVRGFLKIAGLGHQGLVVRAELHSHDLLACAQVPPTDRLARGHIPDYDRVLAPRGHLPAVWAEHRAPDGPGAPLQEPGIAEALALEVVPLPAPQVLRAVVKQILRPADVVRRPRLVRQPDL